MDTISHLALEGIIGWFLLKRYDKENLFLKNTKTRFVFLGLLAFSILPDFDIFLGLHRAYTHSLTWPTICFASGLILWRWNRFRSPQNSLQIGWLSLIFVSFLLYSHILLDITGPYAMGLFYPFSDEQFELVIAIAFNSFEGRVEDIEIGWRKVTLQQQVEESNGIWKAIVPAYPFYLLLFFILFVFYDLIRPRTDLKSIDHVPYTKPCLDRFSSFEYREP